MGIGKSTLHYLRENSRSSKSFKIYRKLCDRLGGENDTPIERSARGRSSR